MSLGISVPQKYERISKCWVLASTAPSEFLNSFHPHISFTIHQDYLHTDPPQFLSPRTNFRSEAYMTEIIMACIIFHRIIERFEYIYLILLSAVQGVNGGVVKHIKQEDRETTKINCAAIRHPLHEIWQGHLIQYTLIICSGGISSTSRVLWMRAGWQGYKHLKWIALPISHRLSMSSFYYYIVLFPACSLEIKCQ